MQANRRTAARRRTSSTTGGNRAGRRPRMRALCLRLVLALACVALAAVGAPVPAAAVAADARTGPLACAADRSLDVLDRALCLKGLPESFWSRAASRPSATDGAPDTPTRPGPLPCEGLPDDDQCELWWSDYDNPNGTGRFTGAVDAPVAMAVSPTADLVYVTGYSGDDSGGPLRPPDMATVAYDQDTGAQAWVARHEAPEGGAERPSAIAVSPDGARVYVTGARLVTTDDYDIVTVAYHARTGQELWTESHDGAAPWSSRDAGVALAVSPQGDRLYVTGYEGTGDAHEESHAVALAYASSDGKLLWANTYAGADDAGAAGLSVSPGATLVYVAGVAKGSGTDNPSDYMMVAYRADTGQRAWRSTYDGAGRSEDQALALAVDPDASRIYVTGRSGLPDENDYSYATVAYSAASGAQLWASRYSGRAKGLSYGAALTVAGTQNPAADDAVETRVYVTGVSAAISRARVEVPYPASLAASYSNSDIGTLAYDAATGMQLWVDHASVGHSDDVGRAVVASPDGGRVYVAGTSVALPLFEAVTLAYDSTNGRRVWSARQSDSEPERREQVTAVGLGVAADGQRVFTAAKVTTFETVPATNDPGNAAFPTETDYRTSAYDAETAP